MAALLASLPSLNPTFGATFIGLLVATFLEGVLTLQTYIYFSNFKEDRLYLRALVATVWFLDTVHWVVVAMMQYEYVITNYANPIALTKALWSFNVSVILTTVIAAMIQIYFTYRTYVLTKSWLVSSSIGIMAFIAFATGIACGVQTFRLVLFDNFLKFRWLVGLWLGCSAFCDILVACALCWTLWTAKTGFRATDSVLTRLIVWTFNTGLLTSVVAVLDLICFATMNNLVHFALNITLGKLYANMFIASLNHRLRNRRTANATDAIDFESRAPGVESNMWAEHISHKSRSKFGALARFGSTGGGMNVHITTTKETSSYAADTPATPLSALDHLNKFRTQHSDVDTEAAVDQKAELVTEDDEFHHDDHEKSVLPRFAPVGKQY